MNPKVPYTKKEDAVILSKITKNPGNIAEAFRQAAKELNRTEGGVGHRYYTNLKKKHSVISVNSSRGVSTLNNHKNVRSLEKIKEEDVLSIIISQVNKLSKRSKLELVNAILS
jgi:hypothetical protein